MTNTHIKLGLIAALFSLILFGCGESKKPQPHVSANKLTIKDIVASQSAGAEKNNEKFKEFSFKEIKAAAENGDIMAQHSLAISYEKGIDVEQDNAKAAYWYKKMAEHGDDEAKYAIAAMYEDGRGVEKSYEKAVYWYKESADMGNKKAQKKLDALISTCKQTKRKNQSWCKYLSAR